MAAKKNMLRQKDILKLRKDFVIRAVYSSKKDLDTNIHLVGGVVRNLVSKLPMGCDYDFVLTSKIKETALRLALILGGSPFLLDKETGSFRIVIRKNNLRVTVDLSPLKGRDITHDLFMRDFTINAMAVNVEELFETDTVEIIDPLKGVSDSRRRCIVLIKDTIFEDDPVRLLRAVRLSAQYGFSISRETENIIKSKAHLLKTSSWERIRDEFFIILNCHNIRHNLKKLYAVGLLQEIFPEIRDWEMLSNYDLMSHIIQAVTEGEKLLYDIKKIMPEYLDAISSHFDSIVENIPRICLFKLGIFLHDIGKPVTMKIDERGIRFTGHDLEGETIVKRIAKRLKLGKKPAKTLCSLVRNHHRIFTMASQEKIPYRTKAHLFRAMDKDGIDLLFLSLADARATRGGEDYRLVQVVRELISFYYNIYSIKKQPPLLKGDDIMRLFKIPEGVMVGRILKKVQDTEGEGRVKNKKEAIEFIRRWLLDESK
ncbi:MAG: CCA tRNA nucleotidyltransferase [Deltaproteobacteria bacterium]|nr:CCA tRNA nucleotidyltransferase [Deltaproteobacteria bacterium]